MKAGERRQAERRQRWRRRTDLPGVDRPRVLLIEPHDDTRVLYANVFEESGYAVYPMANGLEALATAQKRLPDVVVMEMAVPGADGFMILQSLRSAPATADVPAVVVTAMLHFDVPQRARESGATMVLCKPTSIDALLSAVDELVSATPPDRFASRRLRRSLLTLRKVGTQLHLDAAARDRVKALIDRLQIAVMAIDEHGRYVAASAGAELLTGYTRDELLTMSIFDTALGVDLPLARRWEEFVSREDTVSTGTIRDKAGRALTVHSLIVTIVPGLHAAAFATG
jgi:two-component system cell cycle response regulator DivK